MFNTTHPFYLEFIRSLNLSWREGCDLTYPGPAVSLSDSMLMFCLLCYGSLFYSPSGLMVLLKLFSQSFSCIQSLLMCTSLPPPPKLLYLPLKSYSLSPLLCYLFLHPSYPINLPTVLFSHELLPFLHFTSVSPRFLSLPGPTQLSSALMFDAVHVVVGAVRELNRSQEIGVKPLSCTSPQIWQHGTSLMNYLRMVKPPHCQCACTALITH